MLVSVLTLLGESQELVDVLDTTRRVPGATVVGVLDTTKSMPGVKWCVYRTGHYHESARS